MKDYKMRILIAILLFLLTLIALPYCIYNQKFQSNTILLGMSGPFSGGLNSVGNQFLMGANIYLSNLNEQGGVFGRKIQIIAKDDRYEPRLAIENVKELIEQDKVFALFGVIGTPVRRLFSLLLKKKEFLL